MRLSLSPDLDCYTVPRSGKSGRRTEGQGAWDRITKPLRRGVTSQLFECYMYCYMSGGEAVNSDSSGPSQECMSLRLNPSKYSRTSPEPGPSKQTPTLQPSQKPSGLGFRVYTGHLSLIHAARGSSTRDPTASRCLRRPTMPLLTLSQEARLDPKK